MALSMQRNCSSMQRAAAVRAGPIGLAPLVSRRRSVARKAAMPEAPATPGKPEEEEMKFELPTTDDEAARRPFPGYLPMDPQMQALANIPLPLFYPGVLALAAAAGFAGSLVGRGAPVSPDTKPIVSAAVAAVGAGAVVYAGVQAKKKRDGAAVVELYNTLVDLEDPAQLTGDMVEAVGARYGVNMQRDDQEGLKRILGQYLEAIVPSGDVQLKGDEAAKVRAFIDALGLSDDDAAPAFIEVGRRLTRGAIEYKDRQSQFEQRKAFQRLIYLSYIVFGDQKAAFLLPWRRVFNLNDAQLFVARRDNAKAIFNAYLQQNTGGELPADRHFLRELRVYQQDVKLMDDTVQDLVREAARKHVEGCVQRAITALRASAKHRDMGIVMKEAQGLLEYGRKLARMADEDDLVPGLNMPTISGGVFDAENKRRDLRDLYRAFLEESVGREGGFTPALDTDLRDLATMLGLGAREAGDIREEVAARVYRNLLRDEVTSRRIDEAESPAKVLQTLCERASFRPESAAELHKQLFKQKMQQLVSRRKLSDEDGQELARIKRILCIPDDTFNTVVKNTAGHVLEEELSDIFLMGAKPVGDYELNKVDQTIKDLKLDRGVAFEVLKDVTKQRFKAYAQQAQKERDRKAAAAVIRKLVQFNSLVVTPLVEKVRGAEDAKKELAELLAKAAEQAKKEGQEVPGAEPSTSEPAQAEAKQEDAVESVKKMIQASRGEADDEGRKGQKEITLADDLDKGTKAELYKNYLLHSMSGDVVELPVGGVIRKKANMQARQAEMARLQQLGDILGMTQFEVAAVHQDLAEQAYRSQATDLLRGTGSLSGEKKQYLDEMGKSLGLPQDRADKIIQEVRTEVLGASAALEDGQKYTVAKVLELHKEGVNVEKMLEEPTRRALLRKEIDKRLGDGKAEFDADFLLKQLPGILAVDERRVRMLLKELVGSRRRMTLVQAVSQFRQKRPSDAAVSLNNFISATRAQPEEGPLQWNDREELKDLYSMYCAKVSDESKRAELGRLFGLSEEEQAELRSGAGKQVDTLKQGTADDDDMFF